MPEPIAPLRVGAHSAATVAIQGEGEAAELSRAGHSKSNSKSSSDGDE
jgi:hypothetical protein